MSAWQAPKSFHLPRVPPAKQSSKIVFNDATSMRAAKRSSRASNTEAEWMKAVSLQLPC